MADSNLLVVLTVFVALCALSQLGQFLAMFGLYKKVKELQDQSRPLIKKAEQTLESAKLTIEDGRKQISEISGKAHGILDSTQAQLNKVDLLVNDASDRARGQMDRAELVLGDTMDRVQGLVASTHEGLLKPVNEINALMAGVRGGLGFLFKSRRPTVVHATQDEEMFI